MQETNEPTFKIEQYSLQDFIVKIVEGIKLGFELDMHSKANYPMSYGGFFRATMIKPELVFETPAPEDMSKYVIPEDLIKPMPSDEELAAAAEQLATEAETHKPVKRGKQKQ